MNPTHAPVVAALALPLASCLVAEDARPTVSTSTLVSTQYNHRGMIMNEEGVFQADLGVGLPTKRDGTLTVRAFGNVDLSNDTGDAWFPDGHAGNFTEVDLHLFYTESVGDVVLTAGVSSYILPNGTEFVFAPAQSERGETKEVFFRAGGDVFGLQPYSIVHFDIEEADGVYFRAGAVKGFAMTEKTGASVELAVGVNDENHAEWTYGVPEDGGGVSDALLAGTVDYAYDEHTTLFATVGAAKIIDDDIQDWLDRIGIDDESAWFLVGSRWSF